MAASTPDEPTPQGATARFGALVAERRRAVSPDVPIELDDAELARHLRAMAAEYTELRMHYQAGIDEVLTKVNILRTEFEQTGEYSHIEHVRTRLKSPESLIAKAVRVCDELTIPAIREHIMDIAGIRITCSFVSDVYWIATMLRRHPDLEILEVKDYIANPKPNGYRSLHLIVRVPVYLSESTELIPVELQIRTSAQDFWASVEHKLNYKYDRDLPSELAAELDDAATLAAELDARMERLREEIRPMPPQARGGAA
jgi:putative GTP pyrophosphokinase